MTDNAQLEAEIARLHDFIIAVSQRLFLAAEVLSIRAERPKFDMRSPYPWFGGKLTVASLVWSRFGNVRNYCEPFYGSGAVLLDTWECVAWKARGGYGSQAANGDNANPERERIWFSPHCLGVSQPMQTDLFGEMAG